MESQNSLLPKLLASILMPLTSVFAFSEAHAEINDDSCSAAGRKFETITGTSNIRVTRAKTDNITYILNDWCSDAVFNREENNGITLSGNNLCSMGGVIKGRIPLEYDWRYVHDQIGGSGIKTYVDTGWTTVSGIRVHNVEDGYQPRETTAYNNRGRFTLRGAYMTYMRDDSIENDHFMPGLIEDSLFDGVFSFYSEQEQDGVINPVTIGPDEDQHVRFNRVLVRMAPTNTLEPNMPLHTRNVGEWFKIRGSSPHHTAIITDSVFAIGVDPYDSKGRLKWELLRFPQGTTWHGTENYLLWLGEPGGYRGPMPEVLNVAPGAQVRFLEGPAAMAKWLQVTRGWLMEHGYLPKNITAKRIGDEVHLNWSSAPQALSYEVRRDTNRDGGFSSVIASQLSSSSYVDTTAAPGTAYYYTIAAADYCGTAPTTAPVATPPKRAE